MDVSWIFPWIKVLGSLKTFAVPKQYCCVAELCNLSQLFAQLTNRSLCAGRQRLTAEVQMKAVDCNSQILCAF